MICVLGYCLELQLHGNLEVLLFLRGSRPTEVKGQEYLAMVLVYFGNRNLDAILSMALEQVRYDNFVVLLQLVWEQTSG